MVDSMWLLVMGGIAGTALAVALGVAVAVALVSRRTGQRQAQWEQALQTLQRDLRALCNAAVNVGERLNRAERRLQQLTERQEELGVRQEQMGRGEGADQSYQQAIKLAHKGAGVDELIDVCGLTRGEAELIAMMHRLDKAV
jgi:TolA-binding protein